MKIRADFVTNSSSSSYVSLDIKSPLLAKMLKDYERVLEQRGEAPEDRWYDGILGLPLAAYEEEGLVSFEGDEYDGFTWIPASLDQVIPSLRLSLSEECESNGVRLAPLIAAMLENERVLTESIESVWWSHTDQGWGGDHEGRFYPDTMPSEFAESLWKEIAEQKGVPVEELTGDDWFERVADEVSVDETSFTYNRETGEESYEHNYSFL